MHMCKCVARNAEELLRSGAAAAGWTAQQVCWLLLAGNVRGFGGKCGGIGFGGKRSFRGRPQAEKELL